MVKGINRQVLEVQETGSRYFEKALFFVKPEYSRESDSVLRQNALRTIENGVALPKSKKAKARHRFLFLAEMLLSAGAGAVISAIIIK